MSALYTTPIAKNRFSSARFPEALKGLMEERHLSYRQLAYKTKLSAGYLNHLTKGTRPVPADPVVAVIAEALCVEPDFFVEYRLRQVADVLDSAPELAREAAAWTAADRAAVPPLPLPPRGKEGALRHLPGAAPRLPALRRSRGERQGGPRLLPSLRPHAPGGLPTHRREQANDHGDRARARFRLGAASHGKLCRRAHQPKPLPGLASPPHRGSPSPCTRQSGSVPLASRAISSTCILGP